MKRAELSS